MDMIKGRAMYRGWKTTPFTPGMFYDVKVTVADHRLVVSAAKSPDEMTKDNSMYYQDMSDFYYDWIYAFPGDRDDYPEVPIVHDHLKYGWTKSCAFLIEAYARAMRTVNEAISQCDDIFYANELSYLLRTKENLRDMRPLLARITTKPPRNP